MQLMALSSTTRTQVTNVLAQLRGVGKLPHVPLNPKAQAVVAIPLLRERATVERLWHSWRAQGLPTDTYADVIFYVNNHRGASPATVRENAATGRYLQEVITQHPHPQLGMHVVNRYHARSALPRDTSMGCIRNMALSPALRHGLQMDRNLLLFSSDADTFPSPNSLAALIARGADEAYQYGCFEYAHELAPGAHCFDQTFVEATDLLDRTRLSLHHYFRRKQWPRSYDLAGCSTWYTISSFVGVGGYPMEGGEEDRELALLLRRQYPHTECRIESAPLTNLYRVSDRCEGDGAHLAALLNDRQQYMIAGAAVCYALLENWVVYCEVQRPSFKRARELMLQEFAAHLPPTIDLRQLQQSIPQTQAARDIEEQYLAAYYSAVAFLESQSAPVMDAMTSYVPFIEGIVGKEPSFQLVLSGYHSQLGEGSEAYHRAFADYVRMHDPAVRVW